MHSLQLDWSFPKSLFSVVMMSRVVGSKLCKEKKRPSITTFVQRTIEDGIIDKASILLISADNCGKALNISAFFLNNIWIIDFGTIDHMI